MATMTAALFDGKGHMNVVEMDRPKPGPGDVLIRIRETGICGSDLIIYTDLTTPEKIPAGHEVAGEIAEAGPGVDARRVGERIAIETIGHGLACNDCWYCRMGQYTHCQNKAPDQGGGYAQYISRRAFGCYPVTDRVSWEQAALVEPLAVSIHAVRLGRMMGDETVVVLGSGTIGLTAVAAARALGAGTVLASARHEHQAAMAKKLGADVALPPESKEFHRAILDATDGRGADMTLETVGGKSDAIVKESIEVTRKQGRIMTLGNFPVPVSLHWLDPLLKEQAIMFSACYGIIDGRHDYEVAIDLMDSGKVDLGPMVTHHYPLTDIQKGFDTAYNKKTGSLKVHIDQQKD